MTGVEQVMRSFTIRTRYDEHGVMRIQICGRRWEGLLDVNDLITAGELVR